MGETTIEVACGGCGKPFEQGRESVYRWLYRGCRNCGIYVSADTIAELDEQWSRAMRMGGHPTLGGFDIPEAYFDE